MASFPAHKSIFGMPVLAVDFKTTFFGSGFSSVPAELWEAHIMVLRKKHVHFTCDYKINGHDYQATLRTPSNAFPDTTIWTQRNLKTNYQRKVTVTTCYWLNPRVKHLTDLVVPAGAAGAAGAGAPAPASVFNVPWLEPFQAAGPAVVKLSDQFPRALVRSNNPKNKSIDLVTKHIWTRVLTAQKRAKIIAVPARLLAAWQWIGPVPRVVLAKPWTAVEPLVTHKNYRWGFHGTTEDCASCIFQEGFDEKRMGKNGHSYGVGVYLANSAVIAATHGSSIVVCLILSSKVPSSNLSPGAETKINPYRGGVAAVVFPPHHKKRVYPLAVLKVDSRVWD